MPHSVEKRRNLNGDKGGFAFIFPAIVTHA
jgi:hypothetical protein